MTSSIFMIRCRVIGQLYFSHSSRHGVSVMYVRSFSGHGLRFVILHVLFPFPLFPEPVLQASLFQDELCAPVPRAF